MTLRRLYLYLVSAVGLVLLATGIAELGGTMLIYLFQAGAEYSGPQLAAFSAMTLVAAPVWSVHMWFARRFALSDVVERGSAIRRLYVYSACLVLVPAASFAISHSSALLLAVPLDGARFDGLQAAQSAWAAVVLISLWALHYRIADGDRAAVGEQGSSATLRRWYMYPVLLVGLLMLLGGLSDLLAHSGLKALGRPILDYTADSYLSGPAGALIAGCLLWGFHARAISRGRFADDDRQSTLRALEGFIAVFVVIVYAVVGASQILYYAVARGFGVDNPGGAGNDLLAGISGPAFSLILYGLAWLMIRRRLARDAVGGEAARQAGIRRLYTNLAALVSLGALGIGAGGLIWVGAEQLEAPLIGVPSPSWKDPASLWVTLLCVGLGIWLAHWRQAPPESDRQSLSRRLYVYAALLGSVLVLLGSGVELLYVVLREAFSAHPKLSDPDNLDFGRAVAVLAVAAAIGVYHWAVLRADMAARSAQPQPRAFPAVSLPTSRRYELELVGASEPDLRRALDGLPSPARYTIRELDGRSDKKTSS